MSDISKKTLEKIKKEHMNPRPRWIFLTRHYFFWTMFVLTTLMGSIAFGMILYIIMELDWDIYDYLGLNLTQSIFISLPYLWILILFFFLFITYYNFIHTRTGYRYRFLIIFLLSLSISALLGFAFLQYGGINALERELNQKIPVYHHLIYTCENQWMHPEKGLLTGTVLEVIAKDKRIHLQDCTGQEWEINIEQAFIRGHTSLSEGIKIKIIGQKNSETHFQAKEIRVARGHQQGKVRRKEK